LLKIFDNNLNNKYKYTAFNIKKSDLRKIKYLPSVSKEWKNTSYFFDKNKTKNTPENNILINKIIKYFFNLYFKNKFIQYKSIFSKKRRSFLRRIYVSDVEIKYSSNKAIITLYTLNPEKYVLQKRYIKSKIFLNKIKNKIPKIFIYFFKLFKNNKIQNLNKINRYFKLEFLNSFIEFYNPFFKSYLKSILNKKINLARKHIYLYRLNKFKFDKAYFLHKLNSLLLKIFNSKIEYNVINTKYYIYNTDIFTNALSKKLEKKQFSLIKGMNTIVNRIKLPKINAIIERANTKKFKDLNLLENKYRDVSLISILNKENLNKFFINTYNNLYFLKKNKYTKNLNSISIENKIFNNINYKNMGGIKLEVKGRISRRLTAQKTLYKLRLKGGLRNIDSSFKGLSSVLLKGYSNPNTTYSIFKSKRPVGAFAIKGWISGK